MTSLEKAKAVTLVIFLISLLMLVFSTIIGGMWRWVAIISGAFKGTHFFVCSPAELIFALSFLFSIFFGYAFFILRILVKDQWS